MGTADDGLEQGAEFGLWKASRRHGGDLKALEKFWGKFSLRFMSHS